MSIQINQVLFEETTHSPSLIDLVGYEEAQSIVDFCFIANPYYPTADMISQLQERLPVLIKHYPSSNTTTYTEHVAQAIGVDPAHLIMGNGATELITTVCECILENLGVAIPTFSEYVEKMEPEKVHLYSLSSDENYQLDLDHYLVWLQQNQLHAALIINPGNPTGQTFSLVQLHEFLHAATWMDMVIVDESFIDFADEEIPSLLHTAEQFSNLLVLRSMSKHCGVPGLRLGYCYTGNQELVTHLRHVLPTWNLNTLAEVFLSMLPATAGEYHAARRRVIRDVRWLETQLQELPGYFVYPTGANFVLVRIETGMTARDLQMILLQKFKLYVRDCANKQGMDRYHIRVASQGREKDAKLVATLRELSSR